MDKRRWAWLSKTYYSYLKKCNFIPRVNEIALLTIIATNPDPERQVKAKQEIIVGNLRMIAQEAMKIRDKDTHNLTVEDLIGHGVEGMYVAFNKFDYSKIKKQRFSTYAMYWVKKRMQVAALGEGRVISINDKVLLGMRKVKAALEEGVTPDPKEIAAWVRKVFKCRFHKGTAKVCLEMWNSGFYVDSLEHQVTYKEKVSDITPSLIVAMNKLSVMDKDIIVRTVIKEETLDTVAKSYGITRERIRQRQEKALAVLRVELTGEPSENFNLTNYKKSGIL